MTRWTDPACLVLRRNWWLLDPKIRAIARYFLKEWSGPVLTLATSHQVKHATATCARRDLEGCCWSMQYTTPLSYGLKSPAFNDVSHRQRKKATCQRLLEGNREWY